MNLMVILYIIAFTIGAFMIIQDWRFRAVSLWAVALFGVISLIVGALTYASGLYLTFLMMGSCLLFLGIAYHNYMGWADAVLLPCCFAWLSLEEIPPFLIICGLYAVVTAILWHAYYQQKEYPFVPSILFSLFTMLVS